MSRELKETTSRRALIIGMTNTDQVGMWQAPPRAAAAARQEAEVLPDAGDGADAGGGEEAGELNENGLTAEQQAEFDAMREGEPPPAGDQEPPEGDDNDEDDAGDDDTTVQDPPEPPPQQRQPGDKPPAQQQEPAKTPKHVNYSKYQRELKKANDQRAAVEQQLAKEREDRIKLATRVEMINEALQQRPPVQQQPEPEAPVNPFEEADVDPNEDFAGAIAQINRRQRFQLEAQNQVQETFQESREDSAIKETFTRDFSAYAGKDASIHGAYQHLKDARLTQICLGEFGKDPNDPNEQFTPQEVQRMVQMFNNEEKWLVGKAIKEKRSPAAAIMRMAKTFGFDPEAWKAAQLAAQQEQQQQQPPPAARQPAARQPQVPAVQPRAPARQQAPPQQEPTAQEMLEQLRVNQENGRSLSDGGGAPPPTGLSAEMILRLGDKEFEELLDTMPEHQLNAIMGRVPM